MLPWVSGTRWRFTGRLVRTWFVGRWLLGLLTIEVVGLRLLLRPGPWARRMETAP